MFTFIRKFASGKWIVTSAAALALAAPSMVQARENHGEAPDRRDGERHDVEQRDSDRRDSERHDSDRHDSDRHDSDRRDHGWSFNIDRPLFDVVIGGFDRDVPRYRTVTERRWVEPVYQTTVENVWVADQYEDRPVTYYDHRQRITRIEHVLIAPGHFESRENRVCVSEGHWETYDRQVLVSGD